MSWMPSCPRDKVGMRVMVSSNLLVGENLGAFKLSVFMLRLSKLCLREWLKVASAKVIRILEGIRIVSHKKWM